MTKGFGVCVWKYCPAGWIGGAAVVPEVWYVYAFAFGCKNAPCTDCRPFGFGLATFAVANGVPNPFEENGSVIAPLCTKHEASKVLNYTGRFTT
mmetsp:Transcript_10244/g.12327  ORF Transcript_10244/g.12327 Transcript_10244/m.12327 type:complete len:94 (+) Transcript_10244:187-468(+)